MRLLNKRPAARKQRMLRRATRPPRSRPGPRNPESQRSAALQHSKPVGPRSLEHTRSAARLPRSLADPRLLMRPCSAMPIHSAVEERLPLDNAPGREAMDSDPETALDMPHVPQRAAIPQEDA